MVQDVTIPSRCLEGDTAYNRNEPFILDLFEAYEQIFSSAVGGFFRFLSGVDTAPDWLQQEFGRVAKDVDRGSYVQDSDLRQHINSYRAALSEGRTVIIVAHSQGNLYANQAYRLLYDSPEPPDPNQVILIAVATPAAFVADGSRHVTLNGDIITLVPGSLAANTENDGTLCEPSRFGIYPLTIACHKFVPSYLHGTHSAQAIVSRLQAGVRRRPRSVTAALLHRIADPTEVLLQPVLDSVGNIVLPSAVYTSGDRFNMRLRSLAPGGQQRWVTPSPPATLIGGSSSPPQGTVTIGFNNDIVLQAESRVYAFENTGMAKPGWPFRLSGAFLQQFSSTPITTRDDHDALTVIRSSWSSVQANGAVQYIDRIMAIGQDGIERWRHEHAASPGTGFGATRGQIRLGADGNIYALGYPTLVPAPVPLTVFGLRALDGYDAAIIEHYTAVLRVKIHVT